MPLRSPVFIGCTGQGDRSVFPRAGKPYWDSSPAFRAKLYEAEGWFPDLRVIELAVYEDNPKKLVPTEVAQPIAYALALAIAATLVEQGEKAFRRKNTIYGGQSIGTAAAGVLAHAYSGSFGASLVGERSAFMHQACQKTKGKMVALIIYPDALSDIETICSTYGIQVGNYNSPSQIVLTGKIKWVDRAVDKLKEKQLARRVIPLLTEGAYHNEELMAGAVPPMIQWLDQNLPAEFHPQSVLIGNQGQIIASREEAIAELSAGIAQPSRFCAVMDTVYTQFRAKQTIECGPGKVIEGMVNDYKKTLGGSSSKRMKQLAVSITAVTAAAIFTTALLHNDHNDS